MSAHYLPPFDAETFFYIPSQWLAQVATTSELDAGMALLVLIYDHYERGRDRDWADGRVLWKDPDGTPARDLSPTDYWRRFDPHYGAPPLATRQTLRARFAEFGEQGKLFVPYRFPFSPYHVGYELVEWPPNVDELIYCPRGYMLYRWPAWFGQNSSDARTAFLGLCALLTRALRGTRPVATWEVWFTTEEIIHSTTTLLPVLFPHAAGARGQICEGLKQLAALGAIQSVGDRHALQLTTLAALPQCSTASLRDLHADLAPCDDDEPTLALLCWLVNQKLVDLAKTPFDEAVKALLELQGTTWFAAPEDYELFRKYLADQLSWRDENPSKNKMPNLKKLLASYTSRPQGQRVSSTRFMLRFQPDIRARNPENGPKICVPDARDDRKPNVIWLLMRFERTGYLSAQEVIPLVNNAWLVIDQVRDGQKGETPRRTIVPLGPTRPRSREVEMIYRLDGVILNASIDFSLPFQAMLFCDCRHDNLTLNCHFLLVYAV